MSSTSDPKKSKSSKNHFKKVMRHDHYFCENCDLYDDDDYDNYRDDFDED